MKTTISITLVLCLVVCLVTPSFAIKWVVNNNPGQAGNFTTAQAAHNGASVGDTLYFVGSTINYGTLTMTKNLVLIGPGFFISENTQIITNPNSVTILDCALNTGSQNSSIIGMTITNTNGFTQALNINVSNVTIKRCLVTNIFKLNGSISGTVIEQNWIGLYIVGPPGALMLAGSTSNTIIRNNIIAQSLTFSIWSDQPQTALNVSNNYLGRGMLLNSASNTLVNVTNNIIANGVNLNSVNVYNNILQSGGATLTNCAVTNNIGSSTQFPLINGNQQNISVSDVTLFVASGTTDGKYQLNSNAGNPALTAGLDASNNPAPIGPFAGLSPPYVLSGLPTIPSVLFLTAPATGTNNLQGVKLRVRANN